MAHNIQLFTQDDFDNADRIGRMRMALINPLKFQLTDTDSNYLESLSKAYPIYKSNDEATALRLIEHLEGGKWRSQVREIYRDAQRLYDPMMYSKEVLKAVMTQRLVAIADKMTVAMDYFEDEQAVAKAADVARRANADVMKYNRLDVEEAKAGELPPPPQMPTLVVHEMYKNAEKATIVE